MVDWSDIDLVVFDVDGTLYEQGPLRRRMALELAKTCFRSGRWQPVRIVRTFRKVRELLAEERGAFEDRQYQLTAQLCATSEACVRAVVATWLEERPLSFLARYRVVGLERFAEALRRTRRIVAVLSDYPAQAKLVALQFSASHVVCASDRDVKRLKPHPAGLAHLLAATGVPARRAIMIGDRFDRDGAAAEALDMRALIRTRTAHQRCSTFVNYQDRCFQPVLAECGW